MIPVPSRENSVEQLKEEQVATNDAPPSSFLGQLRGVSSVSGLAQFFKGAADVLGNTVGAAILLALFNIIPILMIVLGWVNRNYCPANSNIPVWLIVAGACSLFKSAINFAYRFRDEERRGHPLCVRLLESLMSIFIFIWLIVGSVWVYSAYEQVTYDQKDETYCDHLTYIVSFLFITLTYALFALCVLFLCCCCCCVCFLHEDKETTEPTEA